MNSTFYKFIRFESLVKIIFGRALWIDKKMRLSRKLQYHYKSSTASNRELEL